MQQRVVIITGASSGIGAAIAQRLAASCRLLLVARRAERLQALADSIHDQGGSCAVHAADLADPDAIHDVIQAATNAFGEVEVLINNAGIFRVAPQEQLTAADADQQWAINVRAPMLLTAAALPLLRQTRGLIINVSSIVTENAFPGCGTYTACKLAVEGWSRCLREEERAHGVRVAVLAPGATDTAVFDGMDVNRSKMMRPADIAAATQAIVDLPPTASIERISLMPPAGAF
jgi:short-subunit dehydrogenase